MNFDRLAEQALARCQTFACFSEVTEFTTRTFLSIPMRDCHKELSCWMSGLGMQVRVDAVGNVRGLSGSGERPRLLIGSHLDTVPRAGAYDGILGVCIGLAIVDALRDTALPFDIEILGFSEEEGVRFRKPFLGSLTAIGRFDPTLLELSDIDGCTLRQAIEQFGLDPARIADARVDDRAFAYLEFHIEQGPVLDVAEASLAAVEAIAGQSRLEIVFAGQANHAGTTPMKLRRDALAGAAEWITAVEQYATGVEGLVATVGTLQVSPGAGNVIPGEVRASLDVRHRQDQTRVSAVENLCREGARVALPRGLSFNFQERLNQSAVKMDPHLVRLAEQALEQIGEVPRRMVSGAGHDAMIMAEKLPSIMIFVRTIGGISHHPDESVHQQDVEKAIRIGVAMLTNLAELKKSN